MNHDQNSENERLWKREELIFNVTEDLLLLMEHRGITKAELAKRLSKSKSFVTQILSGNRNMTLGTLADIVYFLESDIKIKVADESITHFPEADSSDWEEVSWSKPHPRASGKGHVIEVCELNAANELTSTDWRVANVS